MILGLRAAARELGISHVRLKALADEGRVPRQADGKFDLEAVREAWSKHREPSQQTKIRVAAGASQPEQPSNAEKVRRAGENLGRQFGQPDHGADYMQIRTRREAVTLAQAAIDLEERTKNLVPIAEARREWADFVMHCKSRAMLIGSRIATKLAGESDAMQCKKLIDREVAAALNELAEWPAHA